MNPQCHVIAISGGKGGVGKSVFAANFSLALMNELKQRVLLIDLDSQSCGDQNVILGLRPTKTVSEVSTFTGTINAQTLSTLVTQHVSGLHFIGAVRTPGEGFEINTEGLKRALTSFSNMYQYIVVDLGTQLQQPQYTVLEVSSACLVLTLPEMLATNQTAKFISQLTTNMFHSDMLLAVINKMPTPASLSPQAVEQVLRRRLLGVIPQDDNLVNASLAKSQPFFMSQPRAPISVALTEMIRRLSQGGFLEKLRALNKPKASSIVQNANSGHTGVRVLGAQSVGSSNAPAGSKKSEGFDVRTALKRRLLVGLLDVVDLKKISEVKEDPVKEQELRVKTQAAVAQLLEKENGNFSREERAQIVKEVMDEALGLGPLEDLLADESISEIMVNRRDMIFVEKKGRIQKVDVSFSSEQQLRLIIERIVSPLGRQINDSSPYVDARLKDGSRVNAVIPPVSIDGSCITIRKFAKVPITWKDYATFGTLTEPMIDFLRICIENKLNVIISGGTGSGKTTLLNVLSGFIPSNERIVTIEDAAELQLKQDHVIRLETKPGNSEGAKPVDIRTLVKNSLRMRPDRIIVGECRGGEALDMLSAMNTGHDGSLTTVHANNPREAVARLETLCLMAGMDLPARAIREQIAGAVDLIIQISRLSDGSRKVTSVAEVVGMQGEVVTMSDIYKFKETGFDKDRKILGQFQSTGTIPSFIEEFERRGVKIPRTLFAATPTGKAG